MKGSYLKILVIIAVEMAFGLFGVNQNRANAQVVEEVIEESLSDISEDAAGFSAEGAEALASEVEHFRRHPININSAGREALEKIGLLTPFQITALLSYIKERGEILSAEELSFVYGFNKEIVMVLRPYISFGAYTRPYEGFWKEQTTTFYTKYYGKYSGNLKNDYLQMRLRTDIRDKITFAALTESDKGEKFGDFNSISLSINELPLLGKLRIKRVVAGDMAAKFGQGLTLWNGFNIMGGEEIYGFSKTGQTLNLYSSADENNYLRGAGITLKFNNLEASFLYSYKGIDASLKEDGSYKSIKKDGLHNTPSLRKAKHSMYQELIAGRIVAEFEKLKVGFSYVTYSYNRHNGSTIKYYNQKQFYDGYHSNLGVDVYAGLWNVRFFAEVATDTKAFAAIAGSSFMIGGFDFHLLGRYYSDSYIAPMARPYTTISTVANQEGGALRVAGPLIGNCKIVLGADYTYYPYYRYNIKASSSAASCSFKVERSSFYDNTQWSVKLAYKENTYYYAKAQKKSTLAIRINGKAAATSVLSLGFKAYCNFVKSEKGSYNGNALGLMANLKIWKEKIKINSGITLYDIEGWESRLYMVESSLPLTFSSYLLYKGHFSYFMVLHAKFSKRAALHLKLRGAQEGKFALQTGIQVTL